MADPKTIDETVTVYQWSSVTASSEKLKMFLSSLALVRWSLWCENYTDNGDLYAWSSTHTITDWHGRARSTLMGPTSWSWSALWDAVMRCTDGFRMYSGVITQGRKRVCISVEWIQTMHNLFDQHKTPESDVMRYWWYWYAVLVCLWFLIGASAVRTGGERRGGNKLLDEAMAARARSSTL